MVLALSLECKRVHWHIDLQSVSNSVPITNSANYKQIGEKSLRTLSGLKIGTFHFLKSCPNLRAQNCEDTRVFVFTGLEPWTGLEYFFNLTKKNLFFK